MPVTQRKMDRRRWTGEDGQEKMDRRRWTGEDGQENNFTYRVA